MIRYMHARVQEAHARSVLEGSAYHACMRAGGARALRPRGQREAGELQHTHTCAQVHIPREITRPLKAGERYTIGDGVGGRLGVISPISPISRWAHDRWLTVSCLLCRGRRCQSNGHLVIEDHLARRDALEARARGCCVPATYACMCMYAHLRGGIRARMHALCMRGPHGQACMHACIHACMPCL